MTLIDRCASRLADFQSRSLVRGNAYVAVGEIARQRYREHAAAVLAEAVVELGPDTPEARPLREAVEAVTPLRFLPWGRPDTQEAT
jgi:hypothetical protein